MEGQLRVVPGAGEPLTGSGRWLRNLDVRVNDHYGQTELGMVLCNHHGLDHPIHMGAADASPGHRVVVLDEALTSCQPANGHLPLIWNSHR